MLSTMRWSARRAFSLVEILVAVVIMAVVAAVVIPTFGGQIRRADANRIGDDGSAIRAGVMQFISDVGQYPSSLGQLTTKIVAGTSTGAIYGVFGQNEKDRWRGPYVNKDASAILQTGYGLTFDNTLSVDSLSTSGLAEAAANQRFLTLCLAIDSLSAAKVDSLYDDGNLSTGLLRWTVNKAGSTDTLKFLLTAIQ
jgi:prepilin-type N-terminal cleavage/methylation domain-containing protein